jgi:hypothetical protein
MPIQPGDRVLVVPVSTTKTHEGTVLAIDERGLTIQAPSGQVFLPWATTESVWRSDLTDEMRSFIETRMFRRDQRAAGSVIDYSLIEDAVKRSAKER